MVLVRYPFAARTSYSPFLIISPGWNAGQPCVGNNEAVESIGYPSLCLQDGPLGVRYASAGTTTAFTPAIHAASTWDIELIRERAQFHAEEAKVKGSVEVAAAL